MLGVPTNGQELVHPTEHISVPSRTTQTLLALHVAMCHREGHFLKRRVVRQGLLSLLPSELLRKYFTRCVDTKLFSLKKKGHLASL